MKKPMLALSALTLVLGPSLSWSADEPAANQAAPAAPAITGGAAANPSNAPSNAPSMGTPSAAAQTPPDNWTSLKGTVQSVDPTAKTVQIKDDTGALLQVPVNRQVSIKKDGKRIRLSQVQSGDIVVLAKRNPTPQEGSKSY